MVQAIDRGIQTYSYYNRLDPYHSFSCMFYTRLPQKQNSICKYNDNIEDTKSTYRDSIRIIIKYLLENYNLFKFYFHKPSEEIALIHDGSYLDCILTIYNNKISKYDGCLSIGYRLIYKEAFERWVRHNQPRIGVSNTQTTRNSFIHKKFIEKFILMIRKSQLMIS